MNRLYVRTSLGLVLMAVLSVGALAQWKPVANPVPDKILNEAQEDAAAGRYEDALAKHVWFHENALTYAPAMYGVRLSFALSYWAALGAMYPPALQKLRHQRRKSAGCAESISTPRSHFSGRARFARSQ
jgi:hypothetical protein